MTIKILSEEPVLARKLRSLHEKSKATRTAVLGKTGVQVKVGTNLDNLTETALDWMEDVGKTMRSREYMVGTLCGVTQSVLVNTILKWFPSLQKTVLFREE